MFVGSNNKSIKSFFGGGECGIQIINEDIGNQLIEIYQL